MSLSRAAMVGCVICLLSAAIGCGRRPAPAPSGAPPTPAPRGQIRQIGSTTLLPLAERWRTEYNRLHPQIDIAVSGGGSGAGIEALTNGSADIADSSRPIKSKEVQAAAARGIRPVEHIVAHDAIAVIVNPKNPLQQISLQTLSDLYAGKTRDWAAAGAPGLGEVQLVNRDSASGTYEAFKELVVTLGGKAKQRDYAAQTLNQTSNQAVLALVAQTKGAIGYVGLGYVSPTVKVLKIMPAGGGTAVEPSEQTVLSKRYPIARPLYCYVNATASEPVRAYLAYIESPAGQKIVSELGFVPRVASDKQ